MIYTVIHDKHLNMESHGFDISKCFICSRIYFTQLIATSSSWIIMQAGKKNEKQVIDGRDCEI